MFVYFVVQVPLLPLSKANGVEPDVKSPPYSILRSRRSPECKASLWDRAR